MAETPAPDGPGWHDEDAPRTGWPFDREGPAPVPVPAGPDPARDARIDTYRDRERRRAARALDRYMDAYRELYDGGPLNRDRIAALDVAGERVVEEVGDYVLARLGDTALNVQQKSHYGATGRPSDDLAPCPVCGLFICEHRPHHNADGVDLDHTEALQPE